MTWKGAYKLGDPATRDNTAEKQRATPLVHNGKRNEIQSAHKRS